MKRKCLGCGNEFDEAEGDLCPRIVGDNQKCGCYSESIKDEAKQSRKPQDKAKGVVDGGN